MEPQTIRPPAAPNAATRSIHPHVLCFVADAPTQLRDRVLATERVPPPWLRYQRQPEGGRRASRLRQQPPARTPPHTPRPAPAAAPSRTRRATASSVRAGGPPSLPSTPSDAMSARSCAATTAALAHATTPPSGLLRRLRAGGAHGAHRRARGRGHARGRRRVHAQPRRRPCLPRPEDALDGRGPAACVPGAPQTHRPQRATMLAPPLRPPNPPPPPLPPPPAPASASQLGAAVDLDRGGGALGTHRAASRSRCHPWREQPRPPAAPITRSHRLASFSSRRATPTSSTSGAARSPVVGGAARLAACSRSEEDVHPNRRTHRLALAAPHVCVIVCGARTRAPHVLCVFVCVKPGLDRTRVGRSLESRPSLSVSLTHSPKAILVINLLALTNADRGILKLRLSKSRSSCYV